MATAAYPGGASAYSADQPFFVRMAAGLALFIVFAFAQHALLGRVDPYAAPVWVHLHGVAMLGWLALLVAQNRIAARGDIARHRKLGRAALPLVAAIVVLGSYAGIAAIQLGRVPPFFTPPFFLALTQIGVAAFAGLVIAALAKRRDTQAHRRLMLGATIAVLDPALGRLLPMPLIGGEAGEWAIMAIQLALMGMLALHDRRVLGRVHPATLAVSATIVLVHVAISLAARSAWMAATAAELAAR